MKGLTVLADENMPAVEALLGKQVRVIRKAGRSICHEDLSGVDVLLVRSVTRIDEELLAGSGVRFVGTATSGFDHVDRDWLSQQGIGFAHAPGSNSNSVVEYVLAAIAAIENCLERLLAGATVGIIGHGHVGSAVATCLRALGGNVRVFDPWLDQGCLTGACSLEAVLECDIISVHAELTSQQPWPSIHLLSHDQLGSLGTGQLLINASRGAVVDNQALLVALQRGAGPNVVIDVWEGEPEVDTELLALTQIGTAHIAGYSLDGKMLATRMLCDALVVGDLLPSLSQAETRAAEPLRLDATGLSSVSLIRQLIMMRYDIRQDDSLLREALDSATLGAFDRLRREYADRRELRGSELAISGLDDSRTQVLRALGCRISAAPLPL